MQSQLDRAAVAATLRRALTTAGVTGAALTLTAAAALPALADSGHGNDHDGAGNRPSQSQSGGSSDQAAAKPQPADSAKPAKPAKSDHHGKSDKPAKSDQATSQSDQKDPAGNNGTFFVKRTANDSHPGNQPHVSCAFYLSFFGFDKGQTLSVTFTGQAPTGKGQPVSTTAPTTLTSTTPAGGAGNDYDGYLGVFDGSNLDLSKLGAPAHNGYHIKVDVATQQGGGHKYKVFWFSPCTTPTTTGGTSTTTPAATTTQTGTTPTTTVGATNAAPAELGTTGQTTGGATVEGLTFTRGTTAAAAAATAAKPQAAPTRVLGEQFSRTPRTSIGIASLPFTGGETALLAGLGAAALGGGAALTLAGRRRRAAGRA